MEGLEVYLEAGTVETYPCALIAVLIFEDEISS